MSSHYNPELRATANPIPPSDVELTARRALEARLTRENSPERIDLRVAAIESEATQLKQARDQDLGRVA